MWLVVFNLFYHQPISTIKDGELVHIDEVHKEKGCASLFCLPLAVAVLQRTDDLVAIACDGQVSFNMESFGVEGGLKKV